MTAINFMVFRLICNTCNVTWRVEDLPYIHSNRCRYFKTWFSWCTSSWYYYTPASKKRDKCCVFVCLSVLPSSRNKYFRLIFLRSYWCQTLDIWWAASASGPFPRLPNFTLVQYSPLNRFPTYFFRLFSQYWKWILTLEYMGIYRTCSGLSD